MLKIHASVQTGKHKLKLLTVKSVSSVFLLHNVLDQFKRFIILYRKLTK